jgi:hypothetical protein
MAITTGKARALLTGGLWAEVKYIGVPSGEAQVTISRPEPLQIELRRTQIIVEMSGR